MLRLQAAIWDGVILSTAFAFSGIFISGFDLPTSIKILFVASILFLLEPGLVSLTGSTIGHALRGLKVEHAHTNKNLNIVMATVRFFAKAVLGLYSLVSILVTSRRQAIHDMVSNSVVVLRHPERFPEEDQMTEQSLSDFKFQYPSKVRRTLITGLYILASLFLLGAAILTLVPGNCVMYNDCSYSDDMTVLASSLVWIGVLFFLVYAGARGLLWGARRRLADS